MSIVSSRLKASLKTFRTLHIHNNEPQMHREPGRDAALLTFSAMRTDSAMQRLHSFTHKHSSCQVLGSVPRDREEDEAISAFLQGDHILGWVSSTESPQYYKCHYLDVYCIQDLI